MARGNSSIVIKLTKSSLTCDVQKWLKERGFDETVLTKFKGMKPLLKHLSWQHCSFQYINTLIFIAEEVLMLL